MNPPLKNKSRFNFGPHQRSRAKCGPSQHLKEAWNPRLLSLDKGNVEKDSLVADLNLGVLGDRVTRGESGVGMPSLRGEVQVSLFDHAHANLRGSPVEE